MPATPALTGRAKQWLEEDVVETKWPRGGLGRWFQDGSVMMQDDVVCSGLICSFCAHLSDSEITSQLLSSFTDFRTRKLFELVY